MVRDHLAATLLTREQLAAACLKRVQRNLAVGTAEVAWAGDGVEAKLSTAAATVQVVGEAELEAVAAAKSRESGLTVPAVTLSLTCKRAAHRADVDTSLDHLQQSLLCDWQRREAVLLTPQ
ncbi:MAG: hypothetical protein K0R38_5273 [Polyangiaceae bacterium]|nr:hypothetical protein [Polyangiaceae bacterium]